MDSSILQRDTRDPLFGLGERRAVLRMGQFVPGCASLQACILLANLSVWGGILLALVLLLE